MKKRTSHNKLVNTNNLQASIQFSLDGFSFCLLNDGQQLVQATKYDFAEKCTTPEELLVRVKEVFEKDANLHFNFQKIEVIHQNNLNSIVPSEYFSESHLKDYLDFNIKTFASDYITFDDIESINAKNVFIPFVNINNYLIDHFGDFNFYHHQTVLIDKLIDQSKETTGIKVFAHLSKSLLDILVIEDAKVLLTNSFEIENSEDFIYYILFVYQQLQLDVNSVPLEIIGSVQKESDIYKHAYTYIRNVLIREDDADILHSTDEFIGSEFFTLI